MASNPDRVYWDSCTYLDYLEGGHPLAPIMEMLIEDWRAGLVTIVTSALTIAEVLYVKCGDPPGLHKADPARRPDIEELFDPLAPARLVVVETNRLTAVKARQLFWDHEIRPKDAVHVASALEADCPVMHTTDGFLQTKSGMVGGAPPLRIEAPTWVRQLAASMEGEPGAFTSLVDPNEPPPPDAQSPDALLR